MARYEWSGEDFLQAMKERLHQEPFIQAYVELCRPHQAFVGDNQKFDFADCLSPDSLDMEVDYFLGFVRHLGVDGDLSDIYILDNLRQEWHVRYCGYRQKIVIWKEPFPRLWRYDRKP